MNKFAYSVGLTVKCTEIPFHLKTMEQQTKSRTAKTIFSA